MSAATAPGARLERADEDRISIILPGDWARIPLESEADANAEITRLIRGRFPRRDELATMRRETREMMRAIARDARESDAALDALAAAGMAIEINTAGWSLAAAEAYPSLDLLARARRREIPLLINADAHFPEFLTRNLDRARALAREAGSSELIRYEQRQPIAYPLAP